MHKVRYKSYLFLEVNLITLAGGSTFMGLQGRALHPYSLSGDSLTPPPWQNAALTSPGIKQRC